MNKAVSVPFKILSLVIVTLLSVGCGEQSQSDLVESAKNNITNGDEAAAILTLKNVLRENPENSRARLMLGEIYINDGFASAAIKELEKALDAGLEAPTLFESLAKAYYLSSDTAGLDFLLKKSRELHSGDSGVSEIVEVFHLLSNFENGNVKRLDASVNLNYEGKYRSLLDAYAKLQSGKIDEAITILVNATSNQTDFAEAYFLLGQFYSIKREDSLSVDAFEKYTEIYSKDLKGKIFLANSYLKNNMYDTAKPLVAELLRQLPEQPLLNFLKSLISYHENSFEEAKSFSDKSIQNGLKFSTPYFISALSSYHLGNLEQSYQRLLSVQDELKPGSKLLELFNLLSVQLGYDINVSSIIENDNELSESDLFFLSSMTDSVDQSNKQLMSQIQSKVKSAKVEGEAALVLRGAMLINLEDVEGIADFRKAVEIAPDSVIANTLLARTLIAYKKYDEALALARNWQKARPNSSTGYSLEGVVLESIGDLGAAEEIFGRAISIEEGDIPANLYFANKLFSEKKVVEAYAHINNILIESPKNISALKLLIALSRELEDEQTAVAWLNRVVASNVDDITLTLLVAGEFFKRSQFEKTLDLLAGNGVSNKPAEYWLLLGNSYYQLNDVEKSLQVYRDWVSSQPKNVLANLKLIYMLEKEGRFDAAFQQIRTTLQQLDLTFLKFMMADYALKFNEVTIAKKVYNELTLTEKGSHDGLLLQSQLLLFEGDAKKALKVVNEALNLESTPKAIWLKANIFLKESRKGDALSLYKKQVNPDTSSLSALKEYAELAILNQEIPLAIELYNKVLGQTPLDINTLNNIAYLQLVNGDTKQALLYSEKAYSLAPNNINVLDTYAEILAETGSVDEAVAVLRKADSFEPGNTRIKNALSGLLGSESMLNREKQSGDW